MQPHPKAIIEANLVQKLRAESYQADQIKSLTRTQLQIIYEKKWFKLMVATAHGGMNMPLPDVVALFECLAWADANVGWCVNLGAGANLFSGYFTSSVAKQIFESPEVCCAGSGAPSGKAIRHKEGYYLSGHWQYASGANHASHFTCNAYLYNELNEPIMKGDLQEMRSFIVPKRQVDNKKNWDAIGLCASSSNDFSIDNVWIPNTHTFSLLTPSPYTDSAIYKFPFETMAIVNMTSMLTGIALHFIDTFKELASIKKVTHTNQLIIEHDKVQEIIKNVSTDLNRHRNYLFDSLRYVWGKHVNEVECTNTEIQHLHNYCSMAATSSRNAMYELYPLCGMSAIQVDQPLNKIWRDFNVASQHYLVSPIHQ
jgi:alkylation response protein AidB-like acyl-CoA dehydrogenase